MYVVNQSLASNDNNMYSDLSGKPLSALAPNTANVATTFVGTNVSNGTNNSLLTSRINVVPSFVPTVASVTIPVNISQLQQDLQAQEINAILEERLQNSQEQGGVLKVKEVTKITENLTINVDDHKHHHHHKNEEACEPRVTQLANYGYNPWGWGWLGSIILWSIIFTVLFWLIFYSLKPAFVLQTDSNQVDTAKVLLAAVIAALILVAAIILIKFLINRSRASY